MRVLIYGTGVIGSLYAVLLAEAGINVTVYARGKRLQSLLSKGLLYWKKDKILTADVKVLSSLETDDCYDFIFLTVREDQLITALEELKDNNSPTRFMYQHSMKAPDEMRRLHKQFYSYIKNRDV